MHQLVTALFHFLRRDWDCISISVMFGYLAGAIVTRRIMAPAFCPRCVRHNKWVEEFNGKDQVKKENSLSYWLKRYGGK